MTREELERFRAEARRRQAAYHQARLAWGQAIGLPYGEQPDEAVTPPPGRLLLKDEEEG